MGMTATALTVAATAAIDIKFKITARKGAGVVELAALEMLCTSKGYRGFESHPFRHLNFIH